MKNIKKLLMLFLFLLGMGGVSAQTTDVPNGNEFSVRDSNLRFPTDLASVRTYLTGNNKYVFAIIQNNLTSSNLNRNDMRNVRYIVFSVDRTEVMDNAFNGKIYVSHFNSNKQHIETFALNPGDSKRYRTGYNIGFERQGYMTYKNYGDYAGVVDGARFTFLYEGPFVDRRTGDNYFAETFRIPRKISQTIRYIDDATGATIAVDQSQQGITGQYFTAKQLPIPGYYIPELPKNSPGYLSPFKTGYTFRQQINDYAYIDYEQIDDDGNMRVRAYNNGSPVDIYRDVNGVRTVVNTLRPNPRTGEYWFAYSGAGINPTYTFSNPFIPRVDEIVYRYRSVAKIIYTSNDSAFPKSSKPYTPNPNDVTKVLDEVVPKYNGWEAYYNGQRIQEGTSIRIANPGVDTTIEYRRIPGFKKNYSRVNPQLRMRVKH